MSRSALMSINDLVDRGALAVSDGYRTKLSEHGRPGYRIVRVADVLDDDVRLTGPDFVSRDFRQQIGSKVGQAGDVLLTTKGTVGRVAIMPETTEPVVYSPQLCYFRVIDAKVINPRYLRYWFSSADFSAQAADRMNNTDMAAYINLADIRSLTLHLPPISEQQGVAEVLGALDHKIASNAAFVQATEDLLAARFAALHLDEEPETGDEVIRLEDLIELNPKVPAPTDSVPVYVDMQKLPVTGMSISQWTHRPAKGGARFQNGDTLLARITPCLENRKTGYVDFLDEDQVAIGSTEYIVMRSRLGVPSGLSFFLAISDRFRSFGIRHMLGTSGRQRLSAGDLRGFRLRATDDEALESFGLASKPLLALVRSRTAETRTLMAMRDALLPQLMSGKIRVKDAEQLVGDVV